MVRERDSVVGAAVTPRSDDCLIGRGCCFVKSKLSNIRGAKQIYEGMEGLYDLLT
jgi:hypothetical protein